jgi:aldose 1-epimerase
MHNKNITKEKFGVIEGKEIDLYTLTNQNGAKVKITNYGATVVSLVVPDRKNNFADVVTGYNSLTGYVNGNSFFGAIVGRYGNRICNGRFKLNGNEYRLTINDGENHLHGGVKGFYKAVWDASIVEDESDLSIKLSLNSPDGDEGYPGNVLVSVTYTLTNANELKIYYEGTTDKPTVLNPTHHSYFNLTGDFNNTILDHELFIDADSTTTVDNKLITTGEIASVENTPMDFRKPTSVGLHINDEDQQLKFGKGYDHNWVLNNYTKAKVRRVASLYDPKTGRFMEVLSDQPGLQFYSGNFLDGTAEGKDGANYKYRTALCLETQHYPDSPNRPEFPSVVLNPGETYHQTTIYRFLTK